MFSKDVQVGLGMIRYSKFYFTESLSKKVPKIGSPSSVIPLISTNMGPAFSLRKNSTGKESLDPSFTRDGFQ
jgi:hypothetical protein